MADTGIITGGAFRGVRAVVQNPLTDVAFCVGSWFCGGELCTAAPVTASEWNLTYAHIPEPVGTPGVCKGLRLAPPLDVATRLPKNRGMRADAVPTFAHRPLAIDRGWLHRLGWLGVALAMMAAACAKNPSESPEVISPLPVVEGQTRAQRLLALDNAIEADYNRLLELILEPPRVDSTPLRSNPELFEIARRLPAMQAERQRLEAEISNPDSGEEAKP